MDGILNAGDTGENNAPPLAGGESQFLQDLRRDLPSKLYRVGLAMSATAAGGLVEQLLAAASARSSSRQQAEAEAEDVPPPPLSQLIRLFLLLVALVGTLCAIYAGRRVELEHAAAAAPTPRWRNKAGVVVYFFCLLLLVTTVSLVGSAGYCELVLNFIDD